MILRRSVSGWTRGGCIPMGECNELPAKNPNAAAPRGACPTASPAGVTPLGGAPTADVSWDGASAAGEAIAELCAVTKTFSLPGQDGIRVLDAVDLVVKEGEFVALLGQSGSGKSTVLRCLTGLSEPSSGRVLCYGESFRGVHPFVSMVFQNVALFPWLTVEENIGVGLMGKPMSKAAKKEAVERAIDLVGLRHYHGAYPREISGGMRQRVGLARALVGEPRLLCMDEAFSTLDVLTAENLRQEILGLWHRRGATLKSILMVTHNVEEAVEMASKICVLFPAPGRIGLVLENHLPYPRDSESPAFRKMVGTIQEAIVRCTLPDMEPTLQSSLRLRNSPRMEPIPCVPVGQLLGLLEVLGDFPQPSELPEVSDEIGREFGETLALVKAAEILGFAETPGEKVLLTEKGVRFLRVGREERRRLFGEGLLELGLFQAVMRDLRGREVVDAGSVLRELSAAFPYENSERMLQTLVAWGRYGGVLDWDRDTNTLRRQRNPTPSKPAEHPDAPVAL